MVFLAVMKSGDLEGTSEVWWTWRRDEATWRYGARGCPGKLVGPHVGRVHALGKVLVPGPEVTESGVATFPGEVMCQSVAMSLDVPLEHLVGTFPYEDFVDGVPRHPCVDWEDGDPQDPYVD